RMTAQLGLNAPTDDDRLRHGRQAAALARAGLTIAKDTVTPALVRARCFAQTDLAGAHLRGRDLEQAAALGRDALRTAADVSSHRTLDRPCVSATARESRSRPSRSAITSIPPPGTAISPAPRSAPSCNRRRSAGESRFIAGND
ncbi:MAG: hypothetical protein ACRDTE_33825, partial [Pseudonocardiaceae bacterium]